MMAATSNDWSVRKLKKAWKPIQRVIYICAPVIVLHWFIAVSFRTQTMLVYGGLLVVWAILRYSTSRPRRAAN